MMNRIVERVERDPSFGRFVHWQRQDPEATTADAITAAARARWRRLWMPPPS